MNHGAVQKEFFLVLIVQLLDEPFFYLLDHVEIQDGKLPCASFVKRKLFLTWSP